LSAHKCCLPLGRSMTISSSTSSNWLTSCRWAPVTTIDSGTQRHEMRVNGTGTAVTRLWQSLPRASGPQHIQNGFKDLLGRHGLSAAARFTAIPFEEFAFRLRDQRFHLGPERIRDFPELYIGNDSSRSKKMSSGRICTIKPAKSIYYLRIRT
jgi:hypothetical protein